MTQTNKILLLLTGVVILIFTTLYYVHRTESVVREELLSQLQTTEATLQVLAEQINKNLAEGAVTAAIPRCSNEQQEELDDYLNQLQSLPELELERARSLIARCARTTAYQKSVMVVRLENEIETYKNAIAVLEAFTLPVENHVEEWSELLQVEKERARLFARQVVIQEEIIDQLKNADQGAQAAIQTLMTEAKDLSEAYSVYTIQGNQLRGQLPNHAGD